MNRSLKTIFVVIAVVGLFGCSRRSSEVTANLHEVAAQTAGEYILDCQFDGLSKDVKIGFKKRILFTNTDNGWQKAESYSSGGFKRDHSRRFTFNTAGYVAQFTATEDLKDNQIVIPADKCQVKVFAGTNSEGHRIELYVGYEDPEAEQSGGAESRKLDPTP